MKGLLCFGTILALIFPLYNVQSKDIFSIEGISSICFVKEKDGKLVYELQDMQNISDVQNAEGLILTFDGCNLDNVRAKLDVRVIKEEIVEGINIIYGYTAYYTDFIYIDGKQANVQIVENEDSIIAGFPIILSGYWCIKALFMEISL